MLLCFDTFMILGYLIKHTIVEHWRMTGYLYPLVGNDVSDNWPCNSMSEGGKVWIASSVLQTNSSICKIVTINILQRNWNTSCSLHWSAMLRYWYFFMSPINCKATGNDIPEWEPFPTKHFCFRQHYNASDDIVCHKYCIHQKERETEAWCHWIIGNIPDWYLQP